MGILHLILVAASISILVLAVYLQNVDTLVILIRNNRTVFFLSQIFELLIHGNESIFSY